MSLGDRIVAAVTPIVPVCMANVYTGDAEEYCEYNATEIPDAYGGNRPWAIRYLVQLHWYFPLRSDPRAVKRQIRQAVMAQTGFTCPTVTDASDLDSGHLVFEFEAVDGEV